MMSMIKFLNCAKINQFFFSLNSRRVLIALLICAYLLPVWLFKYFPTQDGPSHIYNSQILAKYHNVDYGFRDYYDLNLSPFPNWVSHISLSLLMLVLPPLISEKIFLTAYIVIFPLSVFYLSNSIIDTSSIHHFRSPEASKTKFPKVETRSHQRNNLIGFVSFLYIYNYLFLMGFYNFAISVPLFLYALGYWWKYREKMGIKRIVILSILMTSIYFCHLVSYAIAIISLLFLYIVYFRKRIKSIFMNLCCILPSSILMFNYLLSSNSLRGGSLSFNKLSRVYELFIDLMSMNILVSYSRVQSKIAYMVSALMVYLLIHTVWKDKMSAKVGKTGKFSNKDCLLLLSFIILVLYFIMPWSIGAGGWTNDRLVLIASLLILPWFSEGNDAKWKLIFVAFVVMISLLNITYICYYIGILNKEIEEYTAGIQAIGKNKVILPFFFDGYGKSLKIGIFVNAANYYCLNNGGINLGNYEVQFDYFPVKFKESFHPPIEDKEWVQIVHWRSEDIDICKYSDNIDYLIIWGQEEKLTANQVIYSAIRRCYKQILSNRRLRIFIPAQT